MKKLFHTEKDVYDRGVIFLILSFAFSFYYIDIGFAFKPYMIFLILFFIKFLKSFTIHKLNGFEFTLFIFFGYFISTVVFAKYPEYSLRLIAGILLTLFCYIVMRHLFSRASINGIEDAISLGGLVFNALSLFLYIKGIFALNFNLTGNRIIADGILIDRDFPRLIGLTNDPNIFCFYNLIFFFYFLTHSDKKWSKIGVILSGFTMILSLSRGGIIAIIIGLLLMFLTSDARGKLNFIFTLPAGFIAMNILSINFLKIDLWSLIEDRFLTSDGGSGRLVLWEAGIQLFESKPLFGIGIFNYRPYTKALYGRESFMHNTYLDVLTEGGVVGISLYALIFIVVIYTYYLNRNRINDNKYLILTFISMMILMTSLSMVINEIFFLILALIWRYILEIEKKANILPV